MAGQKLEGKNYGSRKAYDYNPLLPMLNYLDSEGHDTGKRMRFVDMCKEFDDNYKYHRQGDPNRLINLVYSVAFMLACKKKYFNDLQDYDRFAWDLALEIGDRFEHPRDPEKPIKSCLNYMKGIIGFRKITFLQKRGGFHVQNPEKDKLFTRPEYLEEYARAHHAALMYDQRRYIMEDFIKSLPEYCRSVIDQSYPKWMRDRIYVSIMLSLKHGRTVRGSLEESFQAVIQMYVNSVLMYIKEELGDIISANELTENDIDLVLGSAWDDVHDENIYAE